jgi:hypothetical protein
LAGGYGDGFLLVSSPALLCVFIDEFEAGYCRSEDGVGLEEFDLGFEKKGIVIG